MKQQKRGILQKKCLKVVMRMQCLSKLSETMGMTCFVCFEVKSQSCENSVPRLLQ